jgi:hypothetical protein
VVEFFLRSRHRAMRDGRYSPAAGREGRLSNWPELRAFAGRMILFGVATVCVWFVAQSGNVFGVSQIGGQRRAILDTGLIIEVGVKSRPPDDYSSNGYGTSFPSDTQQIVFHFYYKSSVGGPGNVWWTQPDGSVTTVPLFLVNGKNEANLPRPIAGYPLGQHTLLLNEGTRPLAEVDFVVVEPKEK